MYEEQAQEFNLPNEDKNEYFSSSSYAPRDSINQRVNDSFNYENNDIETPYLNKNSYPREQSGSLGKQAPSNEKYGQYAA